QSLQADLAKERARQEEQNANEQESKARLPEEPSDTEKHITRLKIRLPNDEGILMRRFRINDTLQVCFLIYICRIEVTPVDEFITSSSHIVEVNFDSAINK
ncbi:unnamed protein product, partial [Rotaria sp. Silwood1]